MSGKFYEIDPWLDPFRTVIDSRLTYSNEREAIITGGISLTDFANGHHWYGLHRTEGGWVFREHAPNATAISLIGTFNGWKEDDRYRLHRAGEGDWVLELEEGMIAHGDLYKLAVRWRGGGGERIPAYVTRAVQDDETKIFSAQVWQPSQ
ncbi:MAG: 1,4-alpha-glucan-branching enzyme, partial [Bacteroidales bacterium]|nr:1,4-alpha-glucan-branching enzyme [Bacteroidales bacterium]